MDPRQVLCEYCEALRSQGTTLFTRCCHLSVTSTSTVTPSVTGWDVQPASGSELRSFLRSTDRRASVHEEVIEEGAEGDEAEERLRLSSASTEVGWEDDEHVEVDDFEGNQVEVHADAREVQACADKEDSTMEDADYRWEVVDEVAANAQEGFAVAASDEIAAEEIPVGAEGEVNSYDQLVLEASASALASAAAQRSSRLGLAARRLGLMLGCSSCADHEDTQLEIDPEAALRIQRSNALNQKRMDSVMKQIAQEDGEDHLLERQDAIRTDGGDICAHTRYARVDDSPSKKVVREGTNPRFVDSTSVPDPKISPADFAPYLISGPSLSTDLFVEPVMNKDRVAPEPVNGKYKRRTLYRQNAMKEAEAEEWLKPKAQTTTGGDSSEEEVEEEGALRFADLPSFAAGDRIQVDQSGFYHRKPYRGCGIWNRHDPTDFIQPTIRESSIEVVPGTDSNPAVLVTPPDIYHYHTHRIYRNYA